MAVATFRPTSDIATGEWSQTPPFDYFFDKVHSQLFHKKRGCPPLIHMSNLKIKSLRVKSQERIALSHF